MPLILHSGLGDSKEVILNSIGIQPDIKLHECTGDYISSADVVIIGPYSDDPIKAVQDVYQKEKLVSVILLLHSDQSPIIKQRLQFTPFVGKNTLCITYRNELNFAEIVTQAIVRTKQRRSFQRINAETKKATAVETRHPLRLEQLGSFLEQAPIGVILIEPGTENVSALNLKAKQLLRVDPSQLKEISLGNIFDERANQIISDLIRKQVVASIGQIEVANNVLEITISDAMNEEGNGYLIMFLNDITYRAQEDRKIRSILEALPQMAWTADSSGRTYFFTKGWYNYTGQTEKDAVGDGWARTVHPDDINALVIKWRESLRTGRVHEHAARFINTAGEARWHLVRGVPVFGDKREITMWVGTCTDIHDHVMRTEELERKVHERTRQLEESNSELEQYARVSSHDLQEPLRKISTFISIINEKAQDSLDENTRRYLDKISATSARMGQTLKDLLKFTRLSRTEQFENVDLNEILKNVLQDLELLISEKQAVISKSTLPTLKAVRVQMSQLFYNLLNNALKYSKPDQQPIITIKSEPVNREELSSYGVLAIDETYCKIVVADNGIGFEQQFAEQIFSIFRRLHHRTEIEGTGIGLAICKKAVANHGGIIDVVSKPGEGSSFSVILPANISKPLLESEN